MLSIAINGKFLSERMQGIVRYARELVRALDDVLDETDRVELVVPPNAHDVPPLRNIAVVPWGRHAGIVWEQLDFARYLRRHRDLVALNLCNVAPLLSRPGVTTMQGVLRYAAQSGIPHVALPSVCGRGASRASDPYRERVQQVANRAVLSACARKGACGAKRLAARACLRRGARLARSLPAA